jgi:hypothetical protein
MEALSTILFFKKRKNLFIISFNVATDTNIQNKKRIQTFFIKTNNTSNTNKKIDSFNVLSLRKMAVSQIIHCIDSVSTDRVHGPVDDDILSCPICRNILWKPIACKTCENSFCLKCIRLWLKEKPNSCPFKCQFQERKPPPILIKLLSKLKLNCQYQPNGCSVLIPYEALEKHELHECLFRLKQCPDCSKEMLYKDIENHQNENCASNLLTCLKCNTIYNRKQGHEYSECLKKQIIIIQEVIDASEQVPENIRDHFNKIVQLYRKQQIEEDYQRKTQLYDDRQHCK